MPAAAEGPRWGDMVDPVLVQAHRPRRVDLDLVAGGQAADQVRAAATGVLGDRENRWDVVTRMRILRGQEGVVKVQLAHRNTVGPSRIRGPGPVHRQHFGMGG